MYLVPNQQGVVEFKLFQRNKEGDLTVLLLYTLILLMEDKNYFSNDYLLGKEGKKGYIDNCFFCGCLQDKSGKEISYFILQDLNLCNLYIKIKRKYKKQKESYIDAVIVFILRKILTTLRKDKGKQFEHILFYDNGNSSNSMILDNDNIYDLKNIYKKSMNTKPDTDDNFSAIHAALKKYCNNKIKIYYALNKDKKPLVPQNIASDFEYCSKTDRATREACRTKEYVRDHIITKERKYKPIYDFVGLKF